MSEYELPNPDGFDMRTDALCLEEDAELFFPLGKSSASPERVEEAREVCRKCPVIVECLEKAMGFGDIEGIWAGQTQEQRRKLKKQKIVGREALEDVIIESFRNA